MLRHTAGYELQNHIERRHGRLKEFNVARQEERDTHATSIPTQTTNEVVQKSSQERGQEDLKNNEWPWSCFTLNKNGYEAQCRTCGHILLWNGSTKAMMKHLLMIHRDGVKMRKDTFEPPSDHQELVPGEEIIVYDVDISEPSQGNCANCSSPLTTTWQEDANGNKVCSNCSLYWKLHVTDQVQDIIQELAVSGGSKLKYPNSDHVESSNKPIANKVNFKAHKEIMHGDMRLCGIRDFATYGSEQMRRHFDKKMKPQQPHQFKMKFVELGIDDGLDGSGRPKPKMANLQIPPDMSHVSDMDSKESHKSQEMAQYSDIQLD